MLARSWGIHLVLFGEYLLRGLQSVGQGFEGFEGVSWREECAYQKSVREFQCCVEAWGGLGRGVCCRFGKPWVYACLWLEGLGERVGLGA